MGFVPRVRIPEGAARGNTYTGNARVVQIHTPKLVMVQLACTA